MSVNHDGPCGPGRRRRHRHRARKERVLHTRVSENLAEDIRRIADDLRLPASNLVRNVLEEVFDVVESVSDDVGELFDGVFREAEAARQRMTRRRGAQRPGADRSAWKAARAEVEEAEQRSAPPPPIEWHVVDKTRSVGPGDHAWLRREVLAGRLTRDTLVWCAGMSDWQPAGDLPALARLFAPPPVPETPPPASESSAEPSPDS